MQCSEFLNIVRTNRPDTIQQTLHLVKERYPSFFDNYVVAYDSRSLHGSSFENPRAIAFSDDAKTILTFNGDQNQNGYERLEIMCFNDRKKTFEFRDIAFPREAINAEELQDIPESMRNEPFVISPINGHPDRDCRMCHGDPPRPNWDTYNLWPGICSVHGPDAHINYSNTVGKKCDAFYEFHKNKGRYSVLGPKPNFPGPEFHLGLGLTRLNGQRIAADLERKRKDIQPIRYQLAEALYCSLTLPLDPKKYGLLDGIDIQDIAPKPFDPRAREMLIQNMQNHAAKLARMETIIGRENTSYVNTQTNRQGLQFLKIYYGVEPKNQREEAGLFDAAREVRETLALARMEKFLKPIGIDIENWSMTLLGGYGHEAGIVALDGGGAMPGIIGEEFARLFLNDEPRMSDIYQQKRDCGHGPSGNTCDISNDKILRQEMCEIVKVKAALEKQKGQSMPLLNDTKTLSVPTYQ